MIQLIISADNRINNRDQSWKHNDTNIMYSNDYSTVMTVII